VGTFEIKSEIADKTNGKVLEEAVLSFDVTETVHGCIGRLVHELELLELSGRDRQHVRKTVHRLNAVRNNNGAMLLSRLKNVLDTIRAASFLSAVSGVNIDNLCLQAADIMAVYGRRLKCTNVMEPRLEPLIRAMD
jgi:hypothetical protein